MSRELTIVASDVAPVGGMERAAYEISRRLLARGWQLTVIARSCALPAGPGLDFRRLRAPSRPISVAMLVSAIQGTWALARHRRGLVQIHAQVVANRVDVMTVQFCERAYLAEVAIPRHSKPTLGHRISAKLASSVDLGIETILLRYGRARVPAAVSGGIVRELERHYPAAAKRATVITNGVDRSQFRPDEAARAEVRARHGLAPDDRVALFVGGDWHRKNLEHAIAGVARSDGWRLLVVGPGDQEQFGAIAEREGARDRVIFAGLQREPAPYYAAADAFTFVSSYEAFSLVTLEAAAAGLVLIVQRINGTEDLVQDGVNGWFVALDGDAIAARLDELAADPAKLAAMRTAARASSVPFDWDAITDDYEALFARLGAGA